MYEYNGSLFVQAFLYWGIWKRVTRKCAQAQRSDSWDHKWEKGGDQVSTISRRLRLHDNPPPRWVSKRLGRDNHWRGDVFSFCFPSQHATNDIQLSVLFDCKSKMSSNMPKGNQRSHYPGFYQDWGVAWKADSVKHLEFGIPRKMFHGNSQNRA